MVQDSVLRPGPGTLADGTGIEGPGGALDLRPMLAAVVFELLPGARGDCWSGASTSQPVTSIRLWLAGPALYNAAGVGWVGGR